MMLNPFVHMFTYGSNAFSILTALLALSIGVVNTVPIQSLSTPFNVSKFTHAPGLYFKKHSSAFVASGTWNVIAFIQFERLRDEFEPLRSNVAHLRKVCYETDFGTPQYSTIKIECKAIIEQLESKINRIEDKNDLIFHKHHRITRRAPLEFVGKISHVLFGTLDSEFEEMYDDDMSQILRNQEHLDLLLKNHTSVIDSSINIAIKHESELLSLNTRINDITRFIKMYRMNSVGVAQHFNLASLSLNQLAFEYEHQQDSILEILTDSHKNHVNHFYFRQIKFEKRLK